MSNSSFILRIYTVRFKQHLYREQVYGLQVIRRLPFRMRNPKKDWDKTLQYRINLIHIQSQLFDLGYSLEGKARSGKVKAQGVENGFFPSVDRNASGQGSEPFPARSWKTGFYNNKKTTLKVVPKGVLMAECSRTRLF